MIWALLVFLIHCGYVCSGCYDLGFAGFPYLLWVCLFWLLSFGLYWFSLLIVGMFVLAIMIWTSLVFLIHCGCVCSGCYDLGFAGFPYSLWVCVFWLF
jgi:hypothetical protein